MGLVAPFMLGDSHLLLDMMKISKAGLLEYYKFNDDNHKTAKIEIEDSSG